MGRLGRHLKVLAIAVAFGLGAYALILAGWALAQLLFG
jgi:hypothetical protein